MNGIRKPFSMMISRETGSTASAPNIPLATGSAMNTVLPNDAPIPCTACSPSRQEKPQRATPIPARCSARAAAQ